MLESPRRTRGVTGFLRTKRAEVPPPAVNQVSVGGGFEDLAHKPQQFCSALLARRTGLLRGISVVMTRLEDSVGRMGVFGYLGQGILGLGCRLTFF